MLRSWYCSFTICFRALKPLSSMPPVSTQQGDHMPGRQCMRRSLRLTTRPALSPSSAPDRSQPGLPLRCHPPEELHSRYAVRAGLRVAAGASQNPCMPGRHAHLWSCSIDSRCRHPPPRPPRRCTQSHSLRMQSAGHMDGVVTSEARRGGRGVYVARDCGTMGCARPRIRNA